jgi:uncharacterized protein (TIGR03032 family)
MVHSFKPVWKPPFISTLAPEDRCPVNGLAMKEGVPRYGTAASCCDVVDGWRERRYEGGILIDVQTDRIVTEDLSMPHSPRLNARVLWVLDSGRGYLCRVEEKSGKTERVAFCPGFAREPSFWRGHALVATSLPRDGAFKGLELKENLKAREGEPRCGAYIFDIRNGDILHWIKFDGAVREMFRCELRRQGAYVRRPRQSGDAHAHYLCRRAVGLYRGSRGPIARFSWA